MGIGSWWNKLRGGSAPIANDERVDLEAPATRVATEKASDRLTIHEYRHTARAMNGPIAVRIFRTEGLSAWQASEVQVMVPADWSDKAIGVARRTLVVQEQLASGGQPATLGGFTALNTQGLPGVEIVAITYAQGVAIPGIPNAGASLVAVLLHPEELALVQQGMGTRVLGHLARRARMFPYPACWEIRTTPVFRLTDQAESFIEKTPRTALGDVRVTAVDESSLEGQPAKLRISLPATASQKLARIWSEPSIRTLTLLARLGPEADGQAVWVPSIPGRHANTIGTTMPQRMGFAFVILSGTDELTSQLRYIEDGIGLILANATLDRVREALITGQDLTMQVGNRTEFVIEVRPEVLVDPFTGALQRAPGGWNSYEPITPRSTTGLVKIDQVVLLLPDGEMAFRVELATLVAFVQSVQDTIVRLATLHPVEAPVAVAVGVTLVPGATPRVQLAFQGERRPALLEPLAKELAALAPISVRDEVPFRIETTVHPHPRSN